MTKNCTFYFIILSGVKSVGLRIFGLMAKLSRLTSLITIWFFTKKMVRIVDFHVEGNFFKVITPLDFHFILLSESSRNFPLFNYSPRNLRFPSIMKYALAPYPRLYLVFWKPYSRKHQLKVHLIKLWKECNRPKLVLWSRLLLLLLETETDFCILIHLLP